MIRLEFTVSGIPISPRARSVGRWQSRVVECARIGLPEDWMAIGIPITVVIVYFHRRPAAGIDVDNMSKPVLDALEGVVIVDDRQVEQLTARKTQLHEELSIQNVTPTLATALESGTDFVLIRIEDAPDHRMLP